MVEETQNDVVLLMNLGHDVLLKFRQDASMTIEAFGQDAAPLRLSRDDQLLLLNALCQQFSFPSPVADIVRQTELAVTQDEPAPGPDPLSYNAEEALPPLPLLDFDTTPTPREDSE